MQLEYHSLEEEETGGRLSPVKPNGEGEGNSRGGPCRVRCPKVQKSGDRQEEGGASAGMMWVDCEMGRCCDEPGRTR